MFFLNFANEEDGVWRTIHGRGFKQSGVHESKAIPGVTGPGKSTKYTHASGIRAEVSQQHLKGGSIRNTVYMDPSKAAREELRKIGWVGQD